jgi:hypothetical protein
MGTVGEKIGVPSRKDYSPDTSILTRHEVERMRRWMTAGDKQGVELRVGLMGGSWKGQPVMPAPVAFVFVSVVGATNE